MELNLESYKNEYDIEPSIFVYTTTYNRGYCLKRCIDSVLNLGFKQLKYLIIDDGSTDNTPMILKEYSSNASIIVRRYEENAGHLTRKLEGELWLAGDFNFCLDSDDYLNPSFKDSLFSRANLDNIDIISFPAKCEKVGELVKLETDFIFDFQDTINFRVPKIDTVGVSKNKFQTLKKKLLKHPFQVITAPTHVMARYNCKCLLVSDDYVNFGWSGDNLSSGLISNVTYDNFYLAVQENLLEYHGRYSKKFSDSIFLDYANCLIIKNYKRSHIIKQMYKFSVFDFKLFLKIILGKYLISKLKLIVRFKGRK